MAFPNFNKEYEAQDGKTLASKRNIHSPLGGGATLVVEVRDQSCSGQD